MEVLNDCSALLSNFEVLALLRELEADHLARTKTAFRIKKEEEHAGHATTYPGDDGVAGGQNLRTMEIEAIQYLSADFQPRLSHPEGITQLVKDLAPYGLTKAEKLQVVNLAPVEPVELYVIVEELEDRLPDQMEPILERVRASLLKTPLPPASPTLQTTLQSAPGIAAGDSTAHALAIPPMTIFAEPDQDIWSIDRLQEEEADMFDDFGGGAGIEGDLEVEED